jgi:hypothetical protein
MSKKDLFNASAQETDAVQKRKQEEKQRRDQRQEELQHKRLLNKENDMEIARREVLQEHHRLECKPSFAVQKSLTKEQIELRATRKVDAKYLRLSNGIEQDYRRNLHAIENDKRNDGTEPERSQEESPHEIKSLFNSVQTERDSRER